jgi:hypothetical protein
MWKAMTLLNETGELTSISDESATFAEFQQFIEGEYFRRPGGRALSVVPRATERGTPSAIRPSTEAVQATG